MEIVIVVFIKHIIESQNKIRLVRFEILCRELSALDKIFNRLSGLCSKTTKSSNASQDMATLQKPKAVRNRDYRIYFPVLHYFFI